MARLHFRSVVALVLLVVLPAGAWPVQVQNTQEETVTLCNAGNAKACNVVGAMYAAGTLVVKMDQTQAFTFFLKACNGGYAIGCANLANQYYNGLGVAMDRSRAVQLYQRSC